jgi:hypothetical protein
MNLPAVGALQTPSRTTPSRAAKSAAKDRFSVLKIKADLTIPQLGNNYALEKEHEKRDTRPYQRSNSSLRTLAPPVTSSSTTKNSAVVMIMSSTNDTALTLSPDAAREKHRIVVAATSVSRSLFSPTRVATQPTVAQQAASSPTTGRARKKTKTGHTNSPAQDDMVVSPHKKNILSPNNINVQSPVQLQYPVAFLKPEEEENLKAGPCDNNSAASTDKKPTAELSEGIDTLADKQDLKDSILSAMVNGQAPMHFGCAPTPDFLSDDDWSLQATPIQQVHTPAVEAEDLFGLFGQPSFGK